MEEALDGIGGEFKHAYMKIIWKEILKYKSTLYYETLKEDNSVI